MNIRINGRTIDKWSNLSVTRIYNSVKSVFSFDIYWDPQDPDSYWRNVLLPGAYNTCTIVSDSGNIVITGVMNAPSFRSGAQKYLVNISGSSITGVLDDVEYSAIVTDTQSNGLTIFQIACNCSNPLGIYVIDNTKGLLSQPQSQNAPDINQKCSGYLDDLCRDINVVLTHDQYGNLLLDTPSNDKVAYNFTDGMPGIEIELSFNGEGMHSKLIGKTSADIANSSPQNVFAYNPYVPSGTAFNFRNAARNNDTIFNAPASQGMQLQIISEYDSANRPGVYIQTDTDATNLQDFINQKLAEELRCISVTVYINTWLLGEMGAAPGMIITILSPENYLFRPTKFFVEHVDLAGDEKSSTAILKCVVPEVYNGKKPINIFTAGNQNLIWELQAGPDRTLPLTQQPNL